MSVHTEEETFHALSRVHRTTLEENYIPGYCDFLKSVVEIDYADAEYAGSAIRARNASRSSHLQKYEHLFVGSGWTYNVYMDLLRQEVAAREKKKDKFDLRWRCYSGAGAILVGLFAGLLSYLMPLVGLPMWAGLILAPFFGLTYGHLFVKIRNKYRHKFIRSLK